MTAYVLSAGTTEMPTAISLRVDLFKRYSGRESRAMCEAQCNYRFTDGGRCYLFLGHEAMGIGHLGLWWVDDAVRRQVESRQALTGDRPLTGQIYRPIF